MATNGKVLNVNILSRFMTPEQIAQLESDYNANKHSGYTFDSTKSLSWVPSQTALDLYNQYITGQIGAEKASRALKDAGESKGGGAGYSFLARTARYVAMQAAGTLPAPTAPATPPTTPAS